MRVHSKLLRRSICQSRVRRRHLDAHDSRVLRAGAGRAVGHPLGKRAPFGAPDLEPLAAFVRYRADRLQQEKRMPRLHEIHPPPESPARQHLPVALVIIAAQ
jgi:hypothetical protein